MKAPQSPIKISGISLSTGLQFLVATSNSLPRSITSDSMIVTIKFKPRTIGNLRDTLRIIHDADTSPSPIIIPLSGVCVESTPPILSIGILRSTVLKNQIEFYGVSNEGLSTMNISLNGTTKVMTPVSGNTRIFSTGYQLTASGDIAVHMIGTDSAQNEGIADRSYTVGALVKNRPFTIHTEKTDMKISRSYSGDDGFILISEHTNSRLASTERRLIRSIEVLSTVRMESHYELSLRYSGEDVAELSRSVPDFDERKFTIVELAQAADGLEITRTIGGSLKPGVITAKIDKPGIYGLVYDANSSVLPKSLELSQNYPNPFNPTTTIRFGLPDASRVQLTIYNVLGQQVRELIRENRSAGYHEVHWDGKNQKGKAVVSGMYIYRLETAAGVDVKKMLLVK